MLLEKTLQQVPANIKDKNESFRLELGRYHAMLVQHWWRANEDLSVILPKSGVQNTPVSEIIATEVYVTG